MSFYLVEYIIRFYLPIFILIALFFGYLKYRSLFERYSLNRNILLILIIGGIIGSFINIPIFINDNLIILINFGAIIIPIFISILFMFKFRDIFTFSILLITLISLVTYLFAEVDPGFGIFIRFPLYFFPILFGILISFLVLGSRKPEATIPMAYSSCTFGVFIGTDILLLPKVLNENIRVGYIGGFGIFDLIYVAGLYAIFIGFLILIIKKIFLRYNL
jgi:uncharacterized membrane protein